MPKIESYRFGSMVISGVNHTNDLIILPDGNVLPNWFRKNGHLLVPDDLTAVLRCKTETLIIGTGASARMNVDPSVSTLAASSGITLFIENTAKSADVYNDQIKLPGRTAACFHLTC